MRLYSYMSGGNAVSVNIPLTAPLITKIYLDSSFEERGGSMHLYIPSTSQANPPSPTEPGVYMEDWDTVLVYYRTVGRKVNEIPDEVWEEEFRNLFTAL